MGNESEFELTRVETVLDNFNKIAIDKFLEGNGHKIENIEWSKKIKLVLHVIEMMQMRQTNEGADKVEEIKKAYLEEVGAVQEVVEALEETLRCDDTEFEIIIDAGQPTESRKWISREEHLEFMIEYAINELGGKVGYLLDDEKNAKK